MQFIRSWLTAPVSTAPLASVRLVFGLLMALSMLRFWANGWIESLYVAPEFHFKYYGFEWVEVLPEPWLQVVFVVCGVSALCVGLGLLYEIAAVLFFLSFTYIELLDKTTYLNHYYFVSLFAGLLMFIPANRTWSLDVWLGRTVYQPTGPAWHRYVLMFQIGVVYFYAGLAKLNPDWLFSALPLAIWLPAKADLPVIGPLLAERWVAYAFSWFGCVYDLTIAFLLLWSRVRVWAYATVVVFHVATWLLFPIGMFPFIMIGVTLLFFSPGWHLAWQGRINRWIGRVVGLRQRVLPGSAPVLRLSTPGLVALVLYAGFQLMWPFRFLAYPGPLFWREEGFRFSWRVMLIEKAGYATFKVRDKLTGRESEVSPSEYLTPLQEKMMATQPDMILEFAHFLGEEYRRKGVTTPEVRCEAWVTLNGRRSRPFIDPTFDLLTCSESFAAKPFILHDTYETPEPKLQSGTLQTP